MTVTGKSFAANGPSLVQNLGLARDLCSKSFDGRSLESSFSSRVLLSSLESSDKHDKYMGLAHEPSSYEGPLTHQKGSVTDDTKIKPTKSHCEP